MPWTLDTGNGISHTPCMASTTTMTQRERAIVGISAQLNCAIRKHVEINPRFYSAAHQVEPQTVKRMFYDIVGSGNTSYEPELGRIEENGGWVRFARTVVRNAEQANGVRHNYWASVI